MAVSRLVAALLLLAASAVPAYACKLACVNGSPTLRTDLAAAHAVVFGRLENARRVGPDDRGTTDLVVLDVLKSHQAVAGKRVIVLPVFVEIKDPKNPPHVLVYGDWHKGAMDWYRGVFLSRSVVDYLQGLLRVDPVSAAGRLVHCFHYLNHPEADIAEDAFWEFQQAAAADLRRAAARLSADKLRAWLADDNTPSTRVGLFAFLLGHCGDQGDIKLLAAGYDRERAKSSSAIDKMLVALVLLGHDQGWGFVQKAIRDPQADFVERYAALRAVRFIRTARPEVGADKQVLLALSAFLDQEDMADFAVEELRKWKCWALTDKVLALHDKKGFDVPIIRRAILCYALQCPDAAAVRHVAARRKADPDPVRETEELLKLMDDIPPVKN